jgi:hypothetical protein
MEIVYLSFLKEYFLVPKDPAVYLEVAFPLGGGEGEGEGRQGCRKLHFVLP